MLRAEHQHVLGDVQGTAAAHPPGLRVPPRHMSASIAAGVIKAAVEVSKKNPLPSAMAPARSRLSAFAEKAQRDKYKGISRAR